MKKRTLFLSCLLALVLSTAALAADYTDVPADSWARESIDKAAEYGLMNGVGEGRFGLGETISREQFVTILVRMFGWESVSGEDAAIDIADSWAREFVNTAAANGVIDAGGKFRPRDAITRREMAVMLVRAIGLGELAKADADAALPFADVTAQRGYIAIAAQNLGGSMPVPTFFWALVFGASNAIANAFQRPCSCVSTKSTTRPRRGSTPSTRSRPTRSSSRPSSSTPSASAGAT
mgnify:CR=1 FL=1